METLTIFPCAHPGCNKDSRYSCSNCKLVSYCGKACQAVHWPEHKKVCRSSLMKGDWRPCWERENRLPEFPNPRLARLLNDPFGREVFLWGNVPAVDILNLAQNEGIHFSQDLAILFAASDDLRNVVKTISDLPQSFAQRIDLALNDKEFHIVARSAILLLFCFTALDVSSISRDRSTDAESLIHIWYSACLSKDITDQLALRVKPLFTEVCGKLFFKATGELVTWTWNFAHNRSLRLSLTKEQWYQTEALCEAPSSLTQQKASHIRTTTTLDPERRDFRDRWFLRDRTPSVRLSKLKFREDGLLLPFGHDRAAFVCPNPTFYLPPSKIWPMDDRCDPLNGWPIQEVSRVRTMAKEDLYGKLYIYLHNVFQQFLDRLSKTEIVFELLNLDAIELHRALQGNNFARIDVSNITDGAYLGTHTTLSRLSPLLQSPDQNPHATIISTYLNATMEMIDECGGYEEVSPLPLLEKYLPGFDLSSFMLQPNLRDLLKLWEAKKLVVDRDKYFRRYMEVRQFDQISAELQVAMKDPHTVVEAWPTGLKLRPEQPGAQEEFDNFLGSNFTCTERFVEWRRTK